MHIGVVEVVLVEVVVVGVVEVEVVGVVVEVLVVLLVEVVLVVLVVGAAVVVVVVVSHGPRSSPWRRWPSTALWGPPWSSRQACQVYGRWLPSVVELAPERGSARLGHCQQRA
jgi:hypothetical protein